MFRAVRSIVYSIGFATSVAGMGAGCAHMIENRAITNFAKNLDAKNLDGLKEVSSDEFNKKALRTATSLEDLEILRLPDGKLSVVEVEDVSKDKKRVTVQVGKEKEKKEVFYELTRDESGRWVVDDIYLKQKKKGIEAYKSVTEQMDLLLTVREFLDAWSHGDREQVLSVTTPKFQGILEALPPAFLAHLTQQVARGKSMNGKFRPSASMDEKIAVVRLPRQTGENVITMELRKGKWKVADIGIASKDEEEKLPSMLNLAHAVNRCVEFLAAYYAEDKDKLATLCLDDFFEGSLSFADLKQAKLPEPNLPEHELQVKLRGNRADFTLRNEKEFVQVDMQREPDTTSGALPNYRVSDVTIYDVATKQEMRLSAMFTAQGMLEVFVNALAHRKIDEIKHCSTRDFTTRVWDKLSEATVPSMPLEAFDSTDIECISASYLGALTKVEVRQGGQQFTYLLRDERGRFLVDDVQWHVTGIPESVKSTLEYLIPIQDFAAGITLGRDPDQQDAALDLIQGNSTSDFNRMVWSQSKFVPNSGMSADTFLQAPLKSIAPGDKEVLVQLGDQQFGARVTLKQENDRFIVDDVLLVAGPEETQRLALRHQLRTLLANAKARAPRSVEPANLPMTSDRRVEQALYEAPATSAKSKNAAVAPPRSLDVDDDPFADLDQAEPGDPFDANQ